MLTRRAFGGAAFGGALVFSGARRAMAQDTDLDAAVDAALAGMSLRERVAQLFTVPVLDVVLSPAEEAFLSEYKPGGVLLVQNNIGTDEQVRALTAAIAASNPVTAPFRAIDQEGG
ncbi:MAG: hypothetical protein ACR2J8_07655, partial [Thermomicrobiales bacterium]